MSNISSFPDMHDVLYTGDNIGTFEAGEEIKAGQVVGFASSSSDFTVVPMDGTSDEYQVGVAIYGAASGEVVSVAMDGCIVYVANEDDSTTIDAGSFVKQGAVKGTVTDVDMSDTGDETAELVSQVVGMALEDIGGDGVGRIMVNNQTITRENAS